MKMQKLPYNIEIRPEARTSSLELIFAIFHGNNILPKLFPHCISLILAFCFGKGRGAGHYLCIL